MNSKAYLSKFFVESKDLNQIKKIGEKILPEMTKILDEFYSWLRSVPEFGHYFQSEEHIGRIKNMQQVHWEDFWNATVNDSYIANRKKVGHTHARIGLPLDLYYSSVVVFNNLFEKAFIRLGLADFETLSAYTKLVSMDVAIVVDTYNAMVRQAMKAQSDALMEMSTPVAQLWKGILMLPIVGIIDSKRAQDIMNAMLHKIMDTQSKAFILDISGVAVVDTAVANHLIKITKASRLMGCLCTISGVSPAVSQTIVELGIHTEEINTTGNMKDALSQAFKLTGVSIHKNKKKK